MNRDKILIFTAGVATGAGVMYWEMSRRIQAGYEDIIDEEDKEESSDEDDILKEEVLEEAKNEGVYDESMENMDADEIAKNIDELIDEEYDEIADEYKMEKENQTVIDYQKVSAKKKKKEKSDMPYSISKDQFKDEAPIAYDKETLFIYEGDGVITNEDDEILDRPGFCIDDAGVVEPEDIYGDDEIPNVMYIRNDVREVDYKILYLVGEKFEDVLAPPETSKGSDRK